MVVIVLVVVAAGLLGYGWSQESTGVVIAGLVVSLVGAALVPVGRWWEARAARTDAENAPEGDAPEVEEPQPDQPDAPAVVAAPAVDAVDGQVVFRPGQMVFHDPACAFVASGPVSRADRAELTGGGMLPCERCLAQPTA